MPLPGDVTTITVTANYGDLAGYPSSGSVTFTPSAGPLTSTLDATFFEAVPVGGHLVAGALSVAVPCTDQFSPPGWVWQVTENITAGPGSFTRTYYVALPSSLGSTVALTALAPLSTAPATFSYLPTSGGTVAGDVAVTGSLTAGGTPLAEPAAGMIQQLVSWDSSVSTFPAQPGVFHLAAATGGNLVLQLPPAAAVPYGGNLAIKRIDSSGHTVTVQPASGEKVNGLTAGVVLSQQGQGRWFHPNTTALGTAAGKGWMSY